MKQEPRPKIGFVCVYTPLALIDAAGYAPYRILPMGECPDQSGHLLHDNICPHVKRILDRALDKDMPDLEGMVFTNSCDAMRRAADAWHRIRPDDPLFLIDLPPTTDASATAFLTGEFIRLADHLAQWRGGVLALDKIRESIEMYNEIAVLLETHRKRTVQDGLPGGNPGLQTLYNQITTEDFNSARKRLKTVLDEVTPQTLPDGQVPVFLFGNVLPDPEVFALFESCGAGIVGDDFCTGSRLFTPLEIDPSKDIFFEMARNILDQPPCARTFDCKRPGAIGTDILERAKACKARGVIGHTLKFCDPYLARLPGVRDVFKSAGIPLLLLEGDCTLRSIGQQRTRIEAFIEMLR